MNFLPFLPDELQEHIRLIVLGDLKVLTQQTLRKIHHLLNASNVFYNDIFMIVESIDLLSKLLRSTRFRFSQKSIDFIVCFQHRTREICDTRHRNKFHYKCISKRFAEIICDIHLQQGEKNFAKLAVEMPEDTRIKSR